MFLTVRRNVTRGRIQKTKTDQIRRVDMSDALIQELQALKRKRQADYLVKGKNEIPEWVFLGNGRLKKDGKDGERNEGQRLDMYNVKNRYFLKTLEKAGLRRIRFHDLRHHICLIAHSERRIPGLCEGPAWAQFDQDDSGRVWGT